MRSNLFFALLSSGIAAITSATALGQGCVAAHVNQRVISELVTTDDGRPTSLFSIHNLTLDIGYRVFNSNKYFQGDNEIARPNAVRNHQNIFGIGIEYRLSQRWSLLADVPVFDGTRNQIYPPTGIFQVSGLGDMLVGAQAWIFRPPTENDGNIAVIAQLKIPTGINDATGTAMLAGKPIKATADQSLQPGDGGWGFTLGTQAYKRLWSTASGLRPGQLSLQS